MPTPIPHIPYSHALILGIIQGATEFLPVSSTAHMRILPALFHWPDPGSAFSAIVQLGPIFAIIAYFRRELAGYIAGIGRSISSNQLFPYGDLDARLGWYTVFGTIPLAIAGIALEKKVDHEYRNLIFIASALIILAVILLIAERVGKKDMALRKLPFDKALLIGFAQALALVPGASRSGVTITAGLFAGLDRKAAADFSFLLSIPAITLAGLFKLRKLVHLQGLSAEAGPYLFAAVVAGIVAYVVINLFLKYLSEDKHTTLPFIIYRIALGIALLFLVHIGFVVPESQ